MERESVKNASCKTRRAGAPTNSELSFKQGHSIELVNVHDPLGLTPTCSQCHTVSKASLALSTVLACVVDYITSYCIQTLRMPTTTPTGGITTVTGPSTEGIFHSLDGGW